MNDAQAVVCCKETNMAASFPVCMVSSSYGCAPTTTPQPTKPDFALPQPLLLAACPTLSLSPPLISVCFLVMPII